MPKSLLSTSLACTALSPWAYAQTASPDTPNVPTLAPVVVTSTQIEQPAFDVPASVNVIDGELMRASQMQVNLSESLNHVPGLLIQNRQNYAQDLQVSIRGFGSRSAFGVRGLRLYVDGIPATMPDGQGQTSNIDMASIERIEVLRGPFSALYGNSSGGVIQVFTEKGSGPSTLTSSLAAGSNHQWRYGLKASGSTFSETGGPELDYVLSANRYTTRGYRDHSGARKNLTNAKLGLQLDDASRLALVMNSVDVKAYDPQGLTYDELMDNPRQASSSALNFNTRKTVKQSQGGLTYERDISPDNTLRLMTYYGQRKTRQYLGIPTASQDINTSPTHSGGVIDLVRDYWGVDARWTTQLTLNNRPLTLIGGVAYDTMTEKRRGYENFIGNRLGVQGNLRRNEKNEVWNIDPYVQASWDFAERWTLDAGLRYSTVRFKSSDRYIRDGNPDDSGSVRYRKALPMAALRYQATDDLNLYVTVGRGFETPTFNEISYRTDTLPGLNFGLQPSVNTSIEVGAKKRIGAHQLTAALFQIRTDNEIVVASAEGGRTTYRNAGRTRRNGLELSWAGEFGRHWQGYAAYTWLDARYRDSFEIPSSDPDAPTVIPDGNRIPGTARQSLFAALSWAPPQGWRAGIEGRYLGKVYVNDENADTAPGYFTAAVHAGYVWHWQNWTMDAFARIDNLLDRRYAGATIINASFGRYYEPAPGRNWSAGVSLSHQF